MFRGIGWKPKENVFYRSWSGDGRHNVIVEAVIDGTRYPAAFKIYPTDAGFNTCFVYVLPYQYSQHDRKSKIPKKILDRSFHFSIPQKSVKIKKKQQNKTLPPEQGYRTTYVSSRR